MIPNNSLKINPRGILEGAIGLCPGNYFVHTQTTSPSRPAWSILTDRGGEVVFYIINHLILLTRNAKVLSLEPTEDKACTPPVNNDPNKYVLHTHLGISI